MNPFWIFHITCRSIILLLYFYKLLKKHKIWDEGYMWYFCINHIRIYQYTHIAYLDNDSLVDINALSDYWTITFIVHVYYICTFDLSNVVHTSVVFIAKAITLNWLSIIINSFFTFLLLALLYFCHNTIFHVVANNAKKQRSALQIRNASIIGWNNFEHFERARRSFCIHPP